MDGAHILLVEGLGLIPGIAWSLEQSFPGSMSELYAVNSPETLLSDPSKTSLCT